MNHFRNPTIADIPTLIKEFRSSDKNTSEAALEALGSVAISECIAPVLEGLADKDDDVRSSTMRGIWRGLEARRAAPDFLEAIFPALVKLLNRRDRGVGGTAPRLLLGIDRRLAIPELLAKEYFTTENSELHYILAALNEIEHQIPHDQLLPLLAALRPLSDKYPHSYEYAAALIAYAYHPTPEAEALFRAELKSTEAKVSEGAAEALAIYHGVTAPYCVAVECEERLGFEGLATPQQQYLAVSRYDGEVNNGGLGQYFRNSSGSSWKSALDGLWAIRAEKRAVVLQEAVSLFGANGPPIDRFLRYQQTATIKKSVLDELSKRYYSCKEENVSVLLSLYVIDHSEHFTQR